MRRNRCTASFDASYDLVFTTAAGSTTFTEDQLPDAPKEFTFIYKREKDIRRHCHLLTQQIKGDQECIATAKKLMKKYKWTGRTVVPLEEDLTDLYALFMMADHYRDHVTVPAELIPTDNYMYLYDNYRSSQTDEKRIASIRDMIDVIKKRHLVTLLSSNIKNLNAYKNQIFKIGYYLKELREDARFGRLDSVKQNLTRLIAFSYSDAEALNSLLTISDDGKSALMIASEEGHEDIVAMLLPHTTEHDNYANELEALKLANTKGHSGIVAKLLTVIPPFLVVVAPAAVVAAVEMSHGVVPLPLATVAPVLTSQFSAEGSAQSVPVATEMSHDAVLISLAVTTPAPRSKMSSLSGLAAMAATNREHACKRKAGEGCEENPGLRGRFGQP